MSLIVLGATQEVLEATIKVLELLQMVSVDIQDDPAVTEVVLLALKKSYKELNSMIDTYGRFRSDSTLHQHQQSTK